MRRKDRRVERRRRCEEMLRDNQLARTKRRGRGCWSSKLNYFRGKYSRSVSLYSSLPSIMHEKRYIPVSLNHDIITSFRIHTTNDTEGPQNMSQVGWVLLFKTVTVCLSTAYQCAQTLCICLMWMGEAVWGEPQPQPRNNHIMLTPQVNPNPKIWSN
jgi:hypothetical protein